MNLDPHSTNEGDWVEMPKSTAAPLVLATGLVLLAMGVATSMAFLPVGAVVFILGLARWINQLLPGNGHEHEPLVEPALRPKPIEAVPGGVSELRQGMPGYRLRLPVKVHPVSAGVKGGIVGGLVMPLPALAYGYFSGHGIWWPGNLLAGMVLPGVGTMNVSALEQFDATLLVTSIIIHVVISLFMGLMYGVLMPTLPNIAKPLAWGALLMPLLWTAVSFVALGQMNPGVRAGIEWPWFVLSQFIFGVVAAIVFMRFESQQSATGGIVRRRRRRFADAGPRDFVEPRRGTRHLVSGQLAFGNGSASRRAAGTRRLGGIPRRLVRGSTGHPCNSLARIRPGLCFGTAAAADDSRTAGLGRFAVAAVLDRA